MGVEVLCGLQDLLGVHRGQVVDIVHARHLILDQLLAQLPIQTLDVTRNLHQRGGASQKVLSVRLLLSYHYSLLLDLIGLESFLHWLRDGLCLCGTLRGEEGSSCECESSRDAERGHV